MLDLYRQRKYLDGRVEAMIEEVLTHSHFVGGKQIEDFEAWLKEYTGFSFAVGVSSGTDALIMALMADGIGQGDAVFLPSFTYVATAEIVLLLGAQPIFVDVDSQNYQMSVEDLEEKIKVVKKENRFIPKAILAVDLFGQPAPWSELSKISCKYDLKLYDDSAQSFGAQYKGQASGKLARATTLSFFPAKPLGAYGDGGAILTDDFHLAEKYRSIRSHGCGKDAYDIVDVGLNARLDTLQAAILLAKTHSFEEECVKRRKNVSFYNEFLPDIFIRPSCLENGKGVWSVYTILLPEKINREECRHFLSEAGIENAVYYTKPLHRQKAYEKFHNGLALPVSEWLCDRVLSLPIHAYLSLEELEKVVEVLTQFAEKQALS
ncbi:DegT/DnrJ/EryC1/StrS aminotransferase family protein [Acetobacteraceae bacterium]|nr:DegT/DnrJ/EryC1/StrS aminotransferase family protein [Acetobacteraceae bacterium]